ncbi:uncharacterized protein LOC131681782 [Topomyia yanbarensis]|uniref:uncharacterized protein LOC131681782 n=1 Tax=Topomyia yanbarensis TaxID=2498891 RepID=UPI00273CBBD6|nr:uncharacterized protein LOC131681782 [Topomyia yanbarensis]
MYKILNSVLQSSNSILKRYGTLQLPALYSTFHPRDFQFDTSFADTGTLIHRFSRHIALTKRDWTDPTRYDFKFSSFYPVYRPDQFIANLQTISSHDLSKLICLTADIKGKTDHRLFTDVVNTLDEETEGRIEQCNFNELARILHGYMYLLRSKITRLETYRKVLPRMIALFEQNKNEKDFMTLVFFLGLWKKNAAGSKLLEQFLKQHLEQFLDDRLGLMDFVILANASFQTSVRLENQKFQDRIVKEICNSENDDTALIVTLVKCARMNRIRSELIVERLRDLMQTGATGSDFREMSHLFAYIADSSIKDDSLIQMFLEQCANWIEKEVTNPSTEYNSPIFRPKDLASFLWSCSNLSIPLANIGVEPSELLNIIFKKIEHGECRFIPDTLVDICLSLWIMNHPSVDLLSTIYGDRQFMQHFMKDRVKIESRRDLLLACAEIERPEAFKIISKLPRVNAADLTRQPPDYLVKKRVGLQRVASCLDGLKEKLLISEVQYNLPIKFLNIAGLLVNMQDGRRISLDVLEKDHCLSDDQTPIGLMNLKTRLLKKLNIEAITINYIRIDSDDELVHALEEAIANVTESKVSKQKRQMG